MPDRFGRLLTLALVDLGGDLTVLVDRVASFGELEPSRAPCSAFGGGE